jgi:hypothetical protein
MSQTQTKTDPLLDHLRNITEGKTLIVLDGRLGTGKDYYLREIARHTDRLFLPIETPEGEDFSYLEYADTFAQTMEFASRVPALKFFVVLNGVERLPHWMRAFIISAVCQSPAIAVGPGKRSVRVPSNMVLAFNQNDPNGAHAVEPPPEHADKCCLIDIEEKYAKFAPGLFDRLK